MANTNLENIDDAAVFQTFIDNNDQQAFNLLYKKHSQKVYAYCLRLMKDRDSAKDVFQKVFFNVIDKKHTFKGGNFIGWLIVIAKNQCMMEKRGIKQTENIDDLEIAADDLRKVDFIREEGIRKAVEGLPEDYKEIIKLRYFDDFSYNEIAEILEISVDLVKVRLFRAKKLLTNILGPFKESLNE